MGPLFTEALAQRCSKKRPQAFNFIKKDSGTGVFL